MMLGNVNGERPGPPFTCSDDQAFGTKVAVMVYDRSAGDSLDAVCRMTHHFTSRAA